MNMMNGTVTTRGYTVEAQHLRSPLRQYPVSEVVVARSPSGQATGHGRPPVDRARVEEFPARPGVLWASASAHRSLVEVSGIGVCATVPPAEWAEVGEEWIRLAENTIHPEYNPPAGT